MPVAIWKNAQEPQLEFYSSVRRMDLKDIPDRLKAAGRSQAELAAHLKLDPSSLTKTIKGTRRLKADEMLKIEAFLADGAEGTVELLAPRRRVAPRRIPVYGYAAAGDDCIVMSPEQVIDWIEPPPLWNGLGDLVAIRVLGDTMEPRLFSGELVIAQIGLPPARDRDCLVEMGDGSARVKTYKGQKHGHVFLKQYNPERELKLQASSIKALHAIIWRR